MPSTLAPADMLPLACRAKRRAQAGRMRVGMQQGPRQQHAPATLGTGPAHAPCTAPPGAATCAALEPQRTCRRSAVLTFATVTEYTGASQRAHR